MDRNRLPSGYYWSKPKAQDKILVLGTEQDSGSGVSPVSEIGCPSMKSRVTGQGARLLRGARKDCIVLLVHTMGNAVFSST